MSRRHYAIEQRPSIARIEPGVEVCSADTDFARFTALRFVGRLAS